MLFLLFSFVFSRKLESLVEKYKKQLGQNPSIEKEEQAILWSLAELARQVDKSVTAEEVELEIGHKINEILERVEIADAILRKDFQNMREEFDKTKEAVKELVSNAKQQIEDEMENFKKQLIMSLQALVDTSGQAQENWVQNSVDKLDDTFTSLKTVTLTRSIIYFVCFQILLIFGVIYYKKLERQLRMFLS